MRTDAIPQLHGRGSLSPLAAPMRMAARDAERDRIVFAAARMTVTRSRHFRIGRKASWEAAIS